MSVLTFAGGVLAWMVTFVCGGILVVGAADDSLSATQGMTLLAATVFTGWVGYRWLGGQET